MNQVQQMRNDFLNNAPLHSIDIKWRHDPPPYAPTPEWTSECKAAIIDALTAEGIIAWPGDGIECVFQIIEAYAKRSNKARLA